MERKLKEQEEQLEEDEIVKPLPKDLFKMKRFRNVSPRTDTNRHPKVTLKTEREKQTTELVPKEEVAPEPAK